MLHATVPDDLQALRSHTPEAHALRAMESAMRADHPLAVAYSGGKDSSVLANLALTAAVSERMQGRCALLVITHADVGAVENPEIRSLVREELARMRRFVGAKGLDLQIRVAQPPQFDSFAVRVIGGRPPARRRAA
jgi:DNA sulfur modification protein DndC